MRDTTTAMSWNISIAPFRWALPHKQYLDYLEDIKEKHCFAVDVANFLLHGTSSNDCAITMALLTKRCAIAERQAICLAAGLQDDATHLASLQRNASASNPSLYPVNIRTVHKALISFPIREARSTPDASRSLSSTNPC